MAPVQWNLQVGGIPKADLRRRLRAQGVELNALAEEFFEDDRFTIAETPYRVVALELSVSDLGFPDGATMPQILQEARRQSLVPCPAELGPHFRLHWQDQPEGHIGQVATSHRAPPMSVTVVSAPISEDDHFPKGFYLRRIEGLLWLRGYRSDDTHLWSPADHLVLCAAHGEA